jgi:hypothetical protein
MFFESYFNRFYYVWKLSLYAGNSQKYRKKSTIPLTRKIREIWKMGMNFVETLRKAAGHRGK